MDLSPIEVKIAKRRLLSAICAFGGHKVSRGLSSNSNKKSQSELDYEQQLPLRYFYNETRLSWDQEENPPVENILSLQNNSFTDHDINTISDRSFDEDISKDENSSSLICKDVTERYLPGEEPSSFNEEYTKRSSESSKAKYRCKLCGQPKQNHTCPYQHSLQRSIGTTTYSALNAHECSEPGDLAPALADMNNFFNHDEFDEDDYIDVIERNGSTISQSIDVTSFGNNIQQIKIDRTLSAMTFGNDVNYSVSDDYVCTLKTKKRKISIKSSCANVRDEHSKEALLLPKVEMKPEQFRAVSVNTTTSSYGSYTYPKLPLTYSQKKCMSDSLFNLSKSRDGLVDECALVLEEAKQTASWDLAVAELLTQVLVAIHCQKGDNTLEGLRQYLLSFGISC